MHGSDEEEGDPEEEGSEARDHRHEDQAQDYEAQAGPAAQGDC